MALKIYQVKADPEVYSLLPADREIWRQMNLFQTQRMNHVWPEPMPFYVRDPVRTFEMDFYNIHVGALGFSEKVLRSDLGEIIERSGEILPGELPEEQRRVLLLNTLACYNCLDRDRSKMRLTPDGKVVIQIQSYAFHLDRIGDQNLFKIPESKNTKIYCVHGRDEPEDEFYYQYIKGGFKGLLFEEVWSSGN